MELLKRFFGSDASEKPVDDAAVLREYIEGFAASDDGQRLYVSIHAGRLVRSLQLTPPGGPEDRILEMGAYMQITPALKKFKHYGEVRGCHLGPVGQVSEKVATSTTGETFHCALDLFDAEHDTFPYPDGHFKTVICCELLEHLSADPMHMLAEVNRILKPGGFLVLNTPNICSMKAVWAVLHGEHPGLYQQFIRPVHGYTDPRHAREYAPSEMSKLLQAAGFELKNLETGPYGLQSAPVDGSVVKLLTEKGFDTHLRGETMHVLGQKVGPVADRFPKWLYD